MNFPVIVAPGRFDDRQVAGVIKGRHGPLRLVRFTRAPSTARVVTEFRKSPDIRLARANPAASAYEYAPE